MKKPKPIPLGALGPRRARFTGTRRPDQFLGHSWSLGLRYDLWRCWRCHQLIPLWQIHEGTGISWCQARWPALLTHNPERKP